MKFVSLFAGIGGFDLGLERAGMQCVAQVEINEFCQRVLTKHWPDVPRFGDIRDVGKHNLPSADLICGGFPCQDVSIAGSRAGLGGKRSTLWTEFSRIICEVNPRWVAIENVTGLFTSDNGQFFGSILTSLADMGYYAEWGVLPTAAFDLPHKRERVFILAHTIGDGWRSSDNRAPAIFTGDGIPNHIQSGYRWQRQNGGHSLKRVGWVVEPAIRGGNDGLPSELDRNRITALGNAVVPQVAEYIGHLIMQAGQVKQ